MNVLKSYARAELTVKNSRFVAEAFPVQSHAGARDLLKAQKAKYTDARHVVHALAVGAAKEVLGMSDDGEPAGTAGRPVLDVLNGRDCTNILLTVTRWFGGILLGTGGLVRAYGDSAKMVLDAAEFEPLVARRQFSFSVPYNLYDNARHIMQSGRFHLSDVGESFAEFVSVSGSIFSDEAGEFAALLRDMSRGTVRVDVR